MKSKYLITSDGLPESPTDDRNFSLDIMEVFYDTIQGEGVFAGVPAVFMRMSGCTLDCSWCDTEWRLGSRYTFEEIFDRFEQHEIIRRLEVGHHLILTGGSPLKQQDNLVRFLWNFIERYKFRPFIEIENECTLMPSSEMCAFIDTWNNSPKLANSGMKEVARIKPDVLKHISKFPTSWFKFVISNAWDYEEVKKDFLRLGLINRHQVILMPEAATKEELLKRSAIVMEVAVLNGVRFSTRQQLILGVS
jgi:6-pyruvoyltetrahydropterin 2'-reductase